MDTDGEQVCIWFSGDAADVRLRSVVAYGDEALIYEPMCTLFSVSAMTAADTLEVDTYIPDLIPNLMLSWRQSDGTEASLLIGLSGESGNVILIEK